MFCSLSIVNFYVIQFTDLPNSVNSNHKTERTANSIFHILKTVLNCRSLVTSRESLKIIRPDLDLKKDLKNVQWSIFHNFIGGIDLKIPATLGGRGENWNFRSGSAQN